MPGNRGGARDGAGRPRNAVKYADEIKQLNDAVALHVMEIFEKGMELVRGVQVQKIVRGKEVIYSQPPCPKMIIFFLERLAGKAVQAIEVEGSGGGPILFDLRLLPQEDLVTLERITRRLVDGGPDRAAERN